MHKELRARGAAGSAQQATHTRPDAFGVGQTGPLPGLQAGMPQERVNEKRTTMKRMIAGMPNAM